MMKYIVIYLCWWGYTVFSLTSQLVRKLMENGKQSNFKVDSDQMVIQSIYCIYSF